MQRQFQGFLQDKDTLNQLVYNAQAVIKRRKIIMIRSN